MESNLSVEPTPDIITDKEARSAYDYICEQIEDIKNDKLREKMKQVMKQWLPRWELPAAVRNHGGFTGGLLCHTRDVLRLALSCGNVSQEVCIDILSKKGDCQARTRTDEDMAKSIQDLNVDSIRVVCILHDMNKIMDPDGQPLYVKNILADKKQSEKKPWITNPEYSILTGLARDVDKNFIHGITLAHIAGLEDNIRIPSGMMSVIAMEKMAPGIKDLLSPEEIQAIMFHDGMYGKGPHSGLEGKETSLVITVHYADMIASRCLN